MTNDLTVSMESFSKQIGRAVEVGRQYAPSGPLYLKLNQSGASNEGLMTYGADGIRLDPDTQWALNVMGLQHGFVVRDRGKHIDERFAIVHEDTVPRPSDGRKWELAYKGQLAGIGGKDNGVQLKYEGATVGIQGFYQKVMDALYMQTQTDVTRIYPLVKFHVENKPTGAKVIYYPVPEIVGWMSAEELAQASTPAATMPAIEAPAALVVEETVTTPAVPQFTVPSAPATETRRVDAPRATNGLPFAV